MRWLIHILFFCATFIQLNQGFAQINFPQGNVLNLETDLKTMYLETRILFNTGKYKAEDYQFKKLSDSIDKRWFISSCFNGDCQNDLPIAGKFMNDYGLNDTSCFIAFHVETFGLGSSVNINYRVYNLKNISDSATLIFNITYLNFAATNLKTTNPIKIVNPVRKNLSIFYPSVSSLDEVKLIDLQGRELFTWYNIDHSTPIPLNDEWNGPCIMMIKAEGRSSYQRIFIEY